MTTAAQADCLNQFGCFVIDYRGTPVDPPCVYNPEIPTMERLAGKRLEGTFTAQ
jgi:hypothetical protein